MIMTARHSHSHKSTSFLTCFLSQARCTEQVYQLCDAGHHPELFDGQFDCFVCQSAVALTNSFPRKESQPAAFTTIIPIRGPL